MLVTNGGKQAVYNTFATLLDPGDEVIVPTPFWTTYPEAIRLAGGVPVEVFAGPEQGYLVTVEQLEAAVTDRTKILLFVSPSNPTGAVYSPEQVTAIGQWAAAKGLWVVTDEIYEHLTYDGVPFTSIATAVPELGDKVVILNGVAKTYAMTGWRVGWMIGPADVIKAATNLQSHATSNVSNIPQIAALAAVSGPLTAVDEMKVAFDRRRKAIVAGLERDRRRGLPDAEGRLLRLRRRPGAAGQGVPDRERPGPARDVGRARRADPRRGGGRGRARRGFRPLRLPAPVLRPGRRGPRAPASAASRTSSARPSSRPPHSCRINRRSLPFRGWDTKLPQVLHEFTERVRTPAVRGKPPTCGASVVDRQT